MVKKVSNGIIEAIPRFNRPAPPPKHDNCGPTCRFWLRKKIKYYYNRNMKLKKFIWNLGEKTDLKAPYGLGWNKCEIWDLSGADTIAEELEFYQKNLKFMKKDNKRLNRLHVDIHKYVKEYKLRNTEKNVVADEPEIKA